MIMLYRIKENSPIYINTRKVGRQARMMRVYRTEQLKKENIENEKHKRQ